MPFYLSKAPRVSHFNWERFVRGLRKTFESRANTAMSIKTFPLLIPMSCMGYFREWTLQGSFGLPLNEVFIITLWDHIKCVCGGCNNRGNLPLAKYRSDYWMRAKLHYSTIPSACVNWAFHAWNAPTLHQDPFRNLMSWLTINTTRKKHVASHMVHMHNRKLQNCSKKLPGTVLEKGNNQWN